MSLCCDYPASSLMTRHTTVSLRIEARGPILDPKPVHLASVLLSPWSTTQGPCSSPGPWELSLQCTPRPNPCLLSAPHTHCNLFSVSGTFTMTRSSDNVLAQNHWPCSESPTTQGLTDFCNILWGGLCPLSLKSPEGQSCPHWEKSLQAQ